MLLETYLRTIRGAARQILLWAKQDLFLTLTLLAAAVTSLIHAPSASYIDFKVILCLFELVVIVKAFEEYALLQAIAVGILKGCKDERALTQTLCLVTFVFAMFVTNDVALLTIIPIMIVISRKSSYDIALPSVFVTVAANLGSSMTPIGNPQNLYLFSHYRLTVGTFFSYSLPLCAAGFVLVLALCLFIRPRQISFVVVEGSLRRDWRLGGFMALGAAVVLSVVGVLPWLPTFFVVLAATTAMNPRVLPRADYKLLLTFAAIFIAIGDVTHMPAVSARLAAMSTTPLATYWTSLLVSQFISNVPATVLMAPFAKSSLALFLGVNVGGLGTPVASLASVITYRLFAGEYPKNRKGFLSVFTVTNLASLAVLGLLFAGAIAWRLRMGG